MNIKELVERLSEIAEAYPEADVMLATQPGYPIAETLRGVADPDAEVAPRDYDGGQIDPSAWDRDADRHESHSEDADGRCLDGCDPPAVVWLVSGGQPTSHDVNPYAPGWVFEVAS